MLKRETLMKKSSYCKKKLGYAISLIAIIAMVSCLSPLENNQTVATITALSPTPSIATLTPPTAAVIPTPSQLQVLEQICLSPQNLSRPLEVELDGIFVAFSVDNPNYFLDLEAKEAFSIPFSLSDHRLFGGRISPNHQWVAFEVDRLDNNGNVIESELVTLDAYGQQITTTPWMEKWGVLRGWLDDEHLFIDGKPPHLGTIFIVNPFSGEVQEFPSTIPNIYNDYPPAIWSILPNSELTLALYLNDSSQEARVGYNLWDMVTGEKIWHQDSRTAPGILPFWSSDWKHFGVVVEEGAALENQSEILIVDNTGHSILQTNFSSSYSYVFIGRYLTWSTDGRYLIFWLSVGSSDNPPQTTSLAVLDLKEGKAIDYCIKSYGSGNKLTWIQDERWLITWSDEVSSNILIDLLSSEAYLFPVPSDGAIAGWMMKPIDR
jgi:hypothetical protein